ncbi:MAG: hypothetical protein KQ78_01249 [Candidatus Izimaplasma bacterium HR2]|nr:MAG: hypothetical protein KQ78_01249 [Candidatus Izimaplasma bacterium HR2]
MENIKNNKILELLYQLLVMKLEKEREEKSDEQNE